MTLAQLAVGIAALALTAVIFAITRALSIEHRISGLETKIGVFWKIIEDGAVGLLHRDDTPETDELLEKVTDLTEDERLELVQRLMDIERDRTRSVGESTAALLMRAVIVAKYSGEK